MIGSSRLASADKLRLAVEDNQLTWAEGKKAGVGEFTAEQPISLIVRFVHSATAS